VAYYGDFARLAGFAAVPESFEAIDFSPSAQAEICAALAPASNHPTVVIAPGSSPVETHKRWPPGHFRQLIQLLLERHPDIRILLIGSVSEKGLLDEVGQGFDPARVGLLAQSSLTVLMGSLRNASVFVSACTGTAHLAALLDMPVVGIYGPTNPLVTGPWTKALRIVSMGYECSPCYAKGYEKGCGNPKCMRDIRPSLVADAIFDAMVLK
jgi:heptosyltransferase-2